MQKDEHTQGRRKFLVGYAAALANGKGDEYGMTPWVYPKAIRDLLAQAESGGKDSLIKVVPALEKLYDQWQAGDLKDEGDLTTDYMETVTEGGPREEAPAAP